MKPSDYLNAEQLAATRADQIQAMAERIAALEAALRQAIWTQSLVRPGVEICRECECVVGFDHIPHCELGHLERLVAIGSGERERATMTGGASMDRYPPSAIRPPELVAEWLRALESRNSSVKAVQLGGHIAAQAARIAALEAERAEWDKVGRSYQGAYDDLNSRIAALEAALAWYAPMRDRGGKARAALGWPEPAPFTDAELRQAAIDRALDEQA